MRPGGRGPGPGGPQERQRGAGRHAEGDARVAPGGVGQVDEVALERRGHVDGAHRVDQRLDLAGGGHRVGRRTSVPLAGVGVEDLELGLAARVADRDAHEEPVELALGQRVGALVLDRVLGGDHHERRLERVGGAVDRDLALLHGLEERRTASSARPG